MDTQKQLQSAVPVTIAVDVDANSEKPGKSLINSVLYLTLSITSVRFPSAAILCQTSHTLPSTPVCV